MGTNRKKLILIIYLFFFIAPSSSCANLKQLAEAAGDNQEQLPIQSLTIMIDPSQRGTLIDQMRKFADKHAFQFLISGSGASSEHFIVEILGDNIKILANDVSGSPGMVAVDFYDQTRANPVSEETITAIDALVHDFKIFLREIPNVTITEEK